MNEQMMIIVVIVIVLGIVLAFFLYKKEKYTDTDLPPGNYIRSCVDIKMSGNTLSAYCRDEDGRINKTSYDTTKPCNYIQNIKGTLICVPPKAPPGNYTYSCNGIQMSGNTLSANCPNGSGGFTKTSYDTTIPCNYIQNINGTLECPDLPPGNYIRSCMDMQMSGNTLSADCWDEYGRINKTSYDTTKPCNNIQNINGTLKCTLPRHSFIGIPREINL